MFTLGSLGFCEFNMMGFSLCSSPTTYEIVIEECTCDYNLDSCISYLDDLIVYSDT